MGWITVLENIAEPQNAVTEEWDGPYIDFLTALYPDGFGCPHKSYINNLVLEIENYDIVLEPDDKITLVLTPADPGMIIVTAIVSAALSFVVNKVINLVFPAKKSSAERASAEVTTPTAGTVYSLTVPTNSAKLGDPIPVIYGQVLATPDIAGFAYQYYATTNKAPPVNTSWDQYVDILLCLGAGEFTVHNLTVSSARAEQLGSIFEYAVFSLTGSQPGQHSHNGNFGSIQAYFFNLNTPVLNVPIFFENAITSVEVPGSVLAPGVIAPRIGTIELDGSIRFDSPLNDGRFVPGVVITADSGVNVHPVNTSGRTVVTVDADKQGAVVTPIYVYDNSGTYTNTLDISIPLPGAPQGPFISSPSDVPVECIQFDFVFPGGLYYQDDLGNFLLKYVKLQIEWWAITDTGDEQFPGAAHNITEFTYSGNTNTPLRYTYSLYPPDKDHRYKVKVLRVSETDKKHDHDEVVLQTIKGMGTADFRPAYGNVTLIACRFKATGQVSGDAVHRIGVNCTRVLPTGGASDNPADHVNDILSNTVYGANRPVSELDTTAMNTVRTASKKFNGVFDQKITVWDAIEAVLQPTRATPVTNGQLVSAVVDKAQTTPKFAFSEDKVVKGSVKYGWTFAQVNDKDGYEVEWRDPTTWVAQYVRYPTAALDVENVTLMGCTNATTATDHAKYLWNQKLYRRKTVVFKTELDGHLPQINDLINVDLDVSGPENYLVTAITPQDDFQVELSCVRYDARVYS